MKGKVSIFYWAKIDYSGWKEQVQKFNESGGNLFYGRDILMSEMTHKAGRAAFGKAIDIALQHMDKDWEQDAERLLDLMQKYMSGAKL